VDALDVIDEIPPGAGAVGLYSSDEFMPAAREFDRALIAATGPRVALLLCADHAHANLNARHAAAYFAKLGARATPLQLAHHPARASSIEPFDLLYIPGGSPADLLSCVKGSAFWDDMLARWRAGAGLAGSSAGAMALSIHCMVPRPGDSWPTIWGDGLGPLQRVSLAVHATSRPREWLDSMAATSPVPMLALDDASGVLLQPGQAPRVFERA
jgi:cyanophycinase